VAVDSTYTCAPRAWTGCSPVTVLLFVTISPTVTLLPPIRPHRLPRGLTRWLSHRLHATAVLLSGAAHAVLIYAIFSLLHATPAVHVGSSAADIALFEPPQLPALLVIPQIEPTPAPTGLPLEAALIDEATTVPDAPQISAPLAGAKHAKVAPSPISKAPPVESSAPPAATDLPIGGGFEGRKTNARAQLVAEQGGSPQSEAAVERGLVWLVNHQYPDGGWRFNHHTAACDKRCRNAGTHESTTAATALALLPLLGAGHTPREGAHQAAVGRGLAYLHSRMIRTPHGGDLQEGTMYGQGLATIALCEAFALTGDPQLNAAAQESLDFIAWSQHLGGGWRYFPGQPGDMTVLGWQWMALKSGQMAGLSVPERTLLRAADFLDRVEAEGGASYGYQGPDNPALTPTAIGLLCRMYSGWRRTNPRLIRGVDLLADAGPSYDDMYFNYYATQVLHHAEAPGWDAWNERLRNHLIATQSSRDHEDGSWYFTDYHTAPGGRLCDTALALMILEVYYRHLPLYGYKSVEF